MNHKQLLQEKREKILEVAAQHKASNIRIFASVARGEETPNSDIDFLVEFHPDCTLLDQISLIQSLEDLLGYSVDITEEDCLHSLIREKVLQEAVEL